MKVVSWPSIENIASSVRNGQQTAVSFVEQSLAAIRRAQEYNAIISENSAAITQAEAIDSAVEAGDDPGRLAGVPFIVKDNFLVTGLETTAASNMLRGFIAPYTATAVARLESEGAILVAKANLDAFAHGSSTENSDFGPTKNPHDDTRVPGGSSGGSAAAVALGLAPFALGTDTGGSIRLPASFCGVVGIKPTYGLISRYGVVAMASSTDVIGPLTSTVADSALVLDVMSGRDSFDSTTIERNRASYDDFPPEPLKGKTIGIIEEHMDEGVDQSVIQAVESSLRQAEESGAIIKRVSIADIARALAVYYVIVPAEVSSNLSRYDGIRFGNTDEHAANLEEVYMQSRSKGFNTENKRRIMMGTYVLSSGYYDAYYKKAQAVRTLLINEFNNAFAEVDFLAGPVSPSVAFKLGANDQDPLKMYLTDSMTVAANLVGNPAISIPVAKDNTAMPIGLQLMAPARHDRELLAAAAKIESIVGYEV